MGSVCAPLCERSLSIHYMQNSGRLALGSPKVALKENACMQMSCEKTNAKLGQFWGSECPEAHTTATAGVCGLPNVFSHCCPPAPQWIQDERMPPENAPALG